MKTCLILLALVPLTIVSAEADEKDDALTKFDSMQQSMEVRLLSFESAAKTILSDANSINTSPWTTIAETCDDVVKKCKLIHTTLANHRSQIYQCNKFSQNEVHSARMYGNSLNQELSAVRGQINAIGLPFTCRLCCNKKYECKQDIQHFIKGITTFVNKIEQEHKPTFLKMVARRRLEISPDPQRKSLTAQEAQRQNSPRNTFYPPPD